VEPLRNRGFRVAEMSDEDLDNIAQIRLLIEVPTISQVASLLTPARFEELAVAAGAIERAAADGDVLQYLDADRRFHVELISAIGNARLTDLVERLRRQARLFGLKDLAKAGRLMASAREHRALLDALRVQDFQAAENLMRAHIGPPAACGRDGGTAADNSSHNGMKEPDQRPSNSRTRRLVAAADAHPRCVADVGLRSHACNSSSCSRINVNQSRFSAIMRRSAASASRRRSCSVGARATTSAACRRRRRIDSDASSWRRNSK